MDMVNERSPFGNKNSFALSYILCIISIISCNIKEHRTKDFLNEVSSSNDIIEKKDCFMPDSTINSLLILNDSESSQEFYPEIASEKLVNGVRESPVLIFSNKSEEYLLLYSYEGGVQNEFSCFEIGYISDLEHAEIKQLEDNMFQTENGLKLGLSFEELIKLKGKCYIEKKDKVIYKIDDYQHCSFLQRHNMPAYYLELTLQNNKITKILFGFEIP